MKAWVWTAALLLACGGTDAVDDGGLDGNGGNDVSTGFDAGGVDTGTVFDASPTDDGASNDGIGDGGGPFDPTQLGTSLVLWLDGAKGITQTNNAVTGWADQTTNHNDATGGSGAGAHQPSINMTAINNLPAVQFAVTNGDQYLEITDNATLQWGTTDFAVFMVAQYSNATTGNGAGQGMFFDKVSVQTNQVTATGPQLIANGAGAQPNSYVGVIRSRIDLTDNVDSVAANYNDGKFHRIGVRRNGAALEVWTDGTSASFTPDAGANVDVGAPGVDVFIGAYGVPFNGQTQISLRLIGGIAEVIGVKGTISDGDTANLDGYFKTKYNLQ